MPFLRKFDASSLGTFYVLCVSVLSFFSAVLASSKPTERMGQESASFRSQPQEEARQLAEAILSVKEHIRLCKECSNFTDQELCEVCRDPKRDSDSNEHQYFAQYHVEDVSSLRS